MLFDVLEPHEDTVVSDFDGLLLFLNLDDIPQDLVYCEKADQNGHVSESRIHLCDSESHPGGSCRSN